jgi:hypothetical protein
MRRHRMMIVMGTVATLSAVGCSSKPAPAVPTTSMQSTGPRYPPRPGIPAPAFKVVHHDASSFTLVTKDEASDAEIESLVWELHDAARTHSFDALKIDQKVVDQRDPIVWLHIYRGAKCATEKFTPGALPCGDSYHAAGDYTLGGFTKPQRDEGVLRQADGQEVHLWNPDAGG